MSADDLTTREREVLRCLARGLDDKATAAELSCSVATVRSHVRNSMRALGAKTRTHAVVLFQKPRTHVSH